MKFFPVVPEICRGQVHGSRKERRRKRRITIIKIITRNGAKTISLPNFVLFGRLNNKKRSKNNKSPNRHLEKHTMLRLKVLNLLYKT
jgi:hypothetical protein